MKNIFGCHSESNGDHPLEDAFKIGGSDRTMVVADGVTQYSYSPDELAGQSCAGRCAVALCETVIKILESNNGMCSDEVICEAFRAANEQIRQLNHAQLSGQTLDYLSCDLCGAVAAAAFICAAGHLHFGVIGDSRVMVKGERTVLSPDGVSGIRRFLAAQEFADRDERYRFVHREFRNRQYQLEGADDNIGYGVLNGEEEALSFCDVQCVPLQDGDLVLVYSDGVTPLVENTTLVDVVEQALTCAADPCRLVLDLWDELPQYRDDKAIIVYKHEV